MRYSLNVFSTRNRERAKGEEQEKKVVERFCSQSSFLKGYLIQFKPLDKTQSKTRDQSICNFNKQDRYVFFRFFLGLIPVKSAFNI